MYQKNLDEQLRIRVSREDFVFLQFVADALNVSISHIVRNLIRSARTSAAYNQSEVVHHGDSDTDQQYIL